LLRCIDPVRAFVDRPRVPAAAPGSRVFFAKISMFCPLLPASALVDDDVIELEHENIPSCIKRCIRR
jgi:hypothetical protein